MRFEFSDFSSNIVRSGNVEKYCRAGQATDGNMAQAHCMLGTEGYKYSGCAICIAAPLQRWLYAPQ
jgi:hypothetical protein